MRIAIRRLVASWLFVSSSFAFAQTPQIALPAGARSLINQDRAGSLVALCADTGEPELRRGSRTIRGTGVWAGQPSSLHRVQAGQGACDPAWSPDGRRLAVTAAEGLWVFPANSAEGDLRVAAKLPLGSSTEFSFRIFSHPEWSPDGVLLGVVVSNGGTSWVEVFEVRSGRLFYTSPPENYSFSWGGARHLKLAKTDIHLPSR